MRRAAALSLGLALLITACGIEASPGAGPTTTGSGSVPTSENPSTTTVTTPATTTITVASTSTAPAAPTTTIAPAPTTTAAPTPTTTAPPADITVVSYFYIDEAGHPERTGPFLLPVTRKVPATKAVAGAAMDQLLAGPSGGEREGVPSISSAIPEGARLLGLTISDGIATVDLSSGFEADDDSAAVAQRIAQVVFTLSRFPTVQEVLFRQEGVAIDVPIGSGQLVQRPVNIGDYLEFAASLHVEEPGYGGRGGDPLHVMGFGAVFEAAFNYALTDDDGLIIAEGNAMTTNGTGWGGFDFTVDYAVDEEQVGALIVWAYSAKDGSQIDVREYPVVLVP
ncbi:MAG: GerMN domain-containing protein [Acidimicrobiia bacterium]